MAHAGHAELATTGARAPSPTDRTSLALFPLTCAPPRMRLALQYQAGPSPPHTRPVRLTREKPSRRTRSTRVRMPSGRGGFPARSFGAGSLLYLYVRGRQRQLPPISPNDLRGVEQDILLDCQRLGPLNRRGKAVNQNVK